MTNESMRIESQNPYGPLTPTELLQRTFSVYREQPTVVFGLILIFAIAELIFIRATASFPRVLHSSLSIGINLLQILFIFCILALGIGLIYLLSQIIQAAFFYVVTAQAERRTITVGEACSLALERIVSLIGVSLQVFFRVLGWEILIGAVLGSMALIAALAAGVTALVHATTVAQRFPAAMILLPIVLLFFALFLWAMFWVIARYAVSVPACLAENLFAGAAVRRSISLSAKSRGRIYTLYLFMSVPLLLSLTIQVPLLLLAQHARNSVTEQLLFQAVASAVNLIFSAAMISFFGIATSLAYYDLRVRKDGFGAVPATMNSSTPLVLAEPPKSIATAGTNGSGDFLPEYDI